MFQSVSGGERNNPSVTVAPTCSSHAEAKERCLGRKRNQTWESGEHDPGDRSSILEGTKVEGNTIWVWGMCVSTHACALRVLGPTPAVSPGFSAQPPSMSVTIHCHLFVEGNAVIWSFSISMWVVAWDMSNDIHIHTLLQSLWTGMCNLGAIHRRSQARHPHFYDP